MIKSHYIPQFILRHFSENERIQYCDLDNRKSERRTIKTTFSEKGYYSEQLEGELCHKTEIQFANLLNKQLLQKKYKVILSPEELFVLKKYLIVATIRFNETEMIKNFANPEEMISSYSRDFFTNISKVLKCTDLNQMTDLMMKNVGTDLVSMMEQVMNMSNYGESKLFSDIKNILHSYIVLVRTNKSKEDFIIPDTGFAFKASHIQLVSNGGFDKCFFTLEHALTARNPHLMQVSRLLTPYDYILCPVSKDFAIISFSVFYKFFNNKSDVYGLLPVSGMTVNSLLSFGSSDLVEPPKVKKQYGKTVAYEYSIKELSKDDVLWLNSNMINTAEHYFGYHNYDGIKRSLKYYNDLQTDERRYDLSFIDGQV